MYILGIGDVYHDVSICLMKDGKILGVTERERINRIKRGMSFSETHYNIQEHFKGHAKILTKLKLENREKYLYHLIEYCLEPFQLTLRDIPVIVTSSLFDRPVFQYRSVLLNHYIAHAASTFYPSNFEEAAILIADGNGNRSKNGELETMMFAVGKGDRIDVLRLITGTTVITEDEKKTRYSGKCHYTQ